MALTNQGPLIPWTALAQPTTASPNTFALDANNDGAGYIFLAPKTGTITKVGVWVASITSPPTYRFGLESTADTTVPSGTYLNSGNCYVDAVPAAGWTWHTLGSGGANVIAGNSIAFTIRYQTGTVGAANLATLNHRIATAWGAGLVGLPFALTLTAGTWAYASGGAIAGVQYSDGTVVTGMLPMSAVTNATWNSGSSPLLRGTKITPVVKSTLAGALIVARLPTTADFTVDVYKDGDGLALASTTVDASQVWASTAVSHLGFVPFEPLTLERNTTYRIVVTPTTVNSQTAWYQVTHPDAVSMAALMGTMAGTTGTNSTTWTDYDTVGNGFRTYPVIPVLSAVDPTAAGSAGGGTGPVGLGMLGLH